MANTSLILLEANTNNTNNTNNNNNNTFLVFSCVIYKPGCICTWCKVILKYVLVDTVIKKRMHKLEFANTTNSPNSCVMSHLPLKLHTGNSTIIHQNNESHLSKSVSKVLSDGIFVDLSHF